MKDTMLIEVTNKKAVKLLHDMEELQLIKVLEENVEVSPVKLSDKYRGVFSKEDDQSFIKHTQEMRKE